MKFLKIHHEEKTTNLWFLYILFIYLFVFFLYLLTDKAATKIQAVYRGHKVRASMKQGDSSSSKDKEASSTDNAGEKTTTKEELEAEFREDDKGTIFFSYTFFNQLKYVCISAVFEFDRVITKYDHNK